MTYQEFYNKNKENERNFKNAVKQGQLTQIQFNQSPYLSYSIEKVNFNRGDGTAEISSKLRNAYTTCFIQQIVNDIMSSNYAHVTNPSKIKGWRHFDF